MSFVVKLNGSNYVSEKRQRAFEEALKDGHQIQLRRGSGNGASAPNPVAPSPARSRPVPVAGPLDHGLLENLELGLARSYEHQKQTLRVHEQYLHNQGDYATIFSQLMQQQHAIFSNGNGAAAPTEATLQALENISHSIEQFHEHQSDTLGVHRQFLDEQATYAQAFIRLLQEQCDAMLHSSGNGNGNVSGRVGESLNQRMNESAVQRTSVGWDGIPTDEAPEPPAAPVSEASPSAAPEDVGRDGIPTDEAPVASAVDVETLTQSLLATVSDKTGYPPEMLELDMDMEADLGIDSIKRVEILSALRDQHPEMPELGTEALTELRTLGEIIEHTQGLMADEQADVGRNGIPTDAPVRAPEASMPSAAPEDVGRDGIPTDEVPVASAMDVEALTQSLLTTVGDKTGYPPEMLELDMDMEADLGIDSIKRVEILSALRDQHPDLPEVGAEALTELRTLGQIIDFMQERGAEKKVSRARQQEHSIRRDGVALSPLPAPDFLKFQLPAGHCCLITDDGSGASAELAAILSQRGWSVVLMSFPSSIVAASTPPELPPEVVRVALPSTSEGHLREQLAAIAETHGPVGAFVHVHPHTDEHERLAYFDDRERALVKAVFLMAKHLQPALTEAVAQEDERAVFLTVTRMDGALGLSEPSETDVMAGGLAGLTKALRLEWPSVFCRAVDVAPALAPERAAQAIFAELHDPNRRIVEVGVRPASRSTIIRGGVGRTCGPKAPWPRDSIPTTPTTDQPASPDADAVFLVSGGAKGITAQCVVAAARRYHSAFVLVGRSAHPDEGGPEPAWSAGVMDEKALKQRAMTHLAESGERPTPKQIRRMVKAVRSRREIRETLAAIEQAGGRAVYVSADVTDGAALRAGVEAALEQLGAPQITGLVHGAGAIADKPIQQKSADDFELVYGVKIDGLKNLLSCAPPETLTHVALFSSVAGFYGNAAQTDYALANEILNKIAHQLRREHPACHVRAIDWGPWDGGMVTPALKRLMARRGIEVIPSEAGADIFAADLASDADAAQIVVGSALAAPARTPDERLRTYRLHRRLSLEANPFLGDHVIGGSAVLPTVCAVAWIANACEQLTPGYTFFRAWEYKALKGVVFDASLADEYVLTLEEMAKSADEITFKAIVSSQTEAQRPRYHYSVEITLRRELPDPPRYPGVNLAATHDVAGVELYEDTTLFHGPAFQGVDRLLNIGPDALTMRCRPPEVSRETQGQFPIQSFNPYLTDAQLQSLLIWATHTYGYGGLPLKIQEGKQYRPVPPGEPVYVSMTVQANSEQKLVADVTAHDADGLVYSQVTGAEITLSSRLNQLFTQNQL